MKQVPWTLTVLKNRRCERCDRWFQVTQPTRRFCTRQCQMNAYFAKRLREDAAFHQRALEHQRRSRRAHNAFWDNPPT